ncbi:hypothetical protein J1N35_025030 [Gossypium stocksii]|uniref:Uncharacterized protein n=1 Tax=Gossypium stocksii TaxID=47602 RepID=A0A9D3V5G9_9ROSI|nr:hypothetical protein J1N35_025030 [Gossypium stocksii]
MREALHTVMGDQTEKNDALKAMAMALKEQVEKLNGELTISKVALGNGMLASSPNQLNMEANLGEIILDQYAPETHL